MNIDDLLSRIISSVHLKCYYFREGQEGFSCACLGCVNCAPVAIDSYRAVVARISQPRKLFPCLIEPFSNPTGLCFRYFGFDPFKYVDRNKEDDIDRHVGPGKAPHERWQVDTSRPPMLPRPLSQVNCVQVIPETLQAL